LRLKELLWLGCAFIWVKGIVGELILRQDKPKDLNKNKINLIYDN